MDVHKRLFKIARMDVMPGTLSSSAVWFYSNSSLNSAHQPLCMLGSWPSVGILLSGSYIQAWPETGLSTTWTTDPRPASAAMRWKTRRRPQRLRAQGPPPAKTRLNHLSVTLCNCEKTAMGNLGNGKQGNKLYNHDVEER